MEEEARLQELDEIKARLNEHGLKATPQRLRVYAAMCALGHASADTVYQRLSGRKGKMTLATVYNVLESMTDAGLLVRRPSFSNKMYFDVNTGNHCHLCLSDTHEMTDLDDTGLQRMAEAYIGEKLPAGLAVDRIEIQILCHRKES